MKFNLEGFLSGIRQNNRTSKLAVLIAATLSTHTPQAWGAPQTPGPTFNVAREFCEVAKKLDYPLSSSERLYSGLSKEEQKILEEHRSFAGLGEFSLEELYDKCLEQEPEKPDK
ncbi:hypothetical protein HYX07_04000 [Candidatus Woesearchaeota archaeon]|nr:hypothetical protein [Candidatus Woesearchaeota archaeon]